MTLQFDTAAHRYTLDGAVVPSVTKILEGMALAPPYKDNKDSLTFGTAVHKACELHATGRLDADGTHPKVMEYVAGFAEKCAEMNIVPIKTELRVFHGHEHYAGTVDLWCKIYDGQHAIIDFKSGTSVPRCVELQTAGYAEALKWMFQFGFVEECPITVGGGMPRRFSMQLTPNRAIVRECKDEYDFPAFIGACRLFKWMKEKRKDQ